MNAAVVVMATGGCGSCYNVSIVVCRFGLAGVVSASGFQSCDLRDRLGGEQRQNDGASESTESQSDHKFLSAALPSVRLTIGKCLIVHLNLDERLHSKENVKKEE